MVVVGVLALQGDFAEHEEALTLVQPDVRTVHVRRPEQLQGLDAIVLPGGESTTMWKLLRLQGLMQPLRDAIAGGLPTLATCAGLILLASDVTGPAQESYGLLDVAVARNGYGRQFFSGTFPLRLAAARELPESAHGVFIRAPRILRCGHDVEVLAWRDDDPVLVRKDNILAACFHPELEHDHFVTEMFLAGVDASARSASAAQS